MRRRPVLLLVLPLAFVGLTACGGGGSITLPTSVPSVSASVPAITVPTITRPTATVETPSETATPEETPTQTVTQTATQTATQTVTQTATATPKPTETPAPTETVTATVTQTPSETPTQTPSETSSTTAPVEPARETTPTSTSSTWWPWVLLLLVLVAGLVWWLLRRRAAQRVLDDWDAKLDASRGEATWVEESLVTQVLSMPTTTEAAGVWTAARPRVLAIDEALLGLEGSAPDESRRASAAALRTQLARLVEAVSADTAAGPDSTPDDFRARRAAIDTARRDLRAALAASANLGASPPANPTGNPPSTGNPPATGQEP